MKTLSDFVKEKSQFISLEGGISYSGIYRGYKFVEKEMRGETKEFARYFLEDLKDHQKRNFDSQSIALAKKMDNVPEGKVVTISKTGEGFDTKYDVEFNDYENQIGVEGEDGGEFSSKIDEKDIPIVEDEIS